MQTEVELLVPRPKHARRTGEALLLSTPADVRVDGPVEKTETAERRLRRVLAEVGEFRSSSDAPSAARPTSITLRYRKSPAAGRDAYRLKIGAYGIDIAASSASGLYYAVETLAQWIRLHSTLAPGPGTKLAGLSVDDAPAFEHRGVLLDISRNKVPKMATLLALVDQLASWKINQLQLYTEHTFAYRDHQIVWRDASPVTAEEIQRLDSYCRERHIELVPNQQSFGHFHRWLAHEPYRRLAECPDGIEHPWSETVEPFGLCPVDPESLSLLEGLYAELLPNFTSRLFNVGLDETLDLGKGRSAVACEQHGRHAVYLDFLESVRNLAFRHDRRIQFWADIILQEPRLCDRIPEDGIALIWGYEADHPFAEQCGQLADAGCEYYVCPGTSSWNSFAGRAQNALQNLAGAARAGQTHGATGFLVTDWGDNGHLQPLSASFLGLLAGAAFAWAAPSDSDADPSGWRRLLDLHALPAPASGLGRVTMALANSYLATGTPSYNGSALFHLAMSPEDTLEHARYAGLTADGIEKVRGKVAHARDDLSRVAPGTESDILVQELSWAADAIDLGALIGRERLRAGRATHLRDLPPRIRGELFKRLDSLVEELRPVWKARNRPGGLEDSVKRLARLRELK